MERPNNVKGCPGSKVSAQIILPSILVVVLLFALLDMASAARPLHNYSGFQSSYQLEGSVEDVAVETFEVESNIGVLPVLQGDRPHDELYRERVLATCTCAPSDDCSTDPNNGGDSPPTSGGSPPDCGR